MRHRWLWIAVFALAVLGCLARRPPEPVAMHVSIPAPAQLAAPAQAPTDPGYGYLDLRVHWPTDDLPGFQAAAIPKTTRSLVVTVYKSSTVWAGPEVASRTPGSGTYSFKRLRVREGDNLSVEVKAFRDEVPILEGASASTLIASVTKASVNIRSATSTSADVTLAPLFIPSIESFSTSIAPVGDTIILYGENLNPVENLQPRVYFGTVEAAEVTSLSATQLRVKVPVNAPTGPVVVKSDGLSSTPDEDNFWVPTALKMDAASESWDPSGGDNRIVVVGASLSLIPRPTFAAATPGPNWPSKEVQYTVGNSSAGTASDASHTFTAGSSVATTSLSVKIGSLESSNALTVSVEDIVSISLSPSTGDLGPFGDPAIIDLIATTKFSSGGETQSPSIVRFDISDPASLTINAATVSAGRAIPTQAVASGSFGTVKVTATSQIRSTLTSTATYRVTASIVSSMAPRWSLSTPFGVAVDASGNAFVTAGRQVFKVLPGGTVVEFAGLPGVSGSTDGASSSATFDAPRGVAVDNSGSVFVADAGSSTIRKVTPSGTVSTVAGLAGATGSVDGTSGLARFFKPVGLALDSSGNLFIADTSNHAIRKLSPDGIVSTLATGLYYPGSVAVDETGNVYVANTGAGSVVRITSSGGMQQIATGLTDPRGVAVSSKGSVYVSESSYFERIRRISRGTANSQYVPPGWQVTTLAGPETRRELIDEDRYGNKVVGHKDGLGVSALFYEPMGIAIDAAGTVFVADSNNGTIRKIVQFVP